MTDLDPDAMARKLAAESLAEGDPTGWFERLYVAAGSGDAVVPWDHEEPQRLLAEWAHVRNLRGHRALVVGCGFGRDAEFMATLGFDVDAFDFSETAVAQARARHLRSSVRYHFADLLDPPAAWRRRFDLVVESLTVQSLPPYLHAAAIAEVVGFVAPGGTLLVIAVAREESDPVEGPPWPLTRAEIDSFALDLEPVRIEQLADPADPGLVRWRAEFRRPAP